MKNQISYNVHGQRVGDRDKLLKHIAKIKPAWILVMDSLDICRDIKQVSPGTNVIHRAYPDEEFWKSTKPVDWVNRKRDEVKDTDVWCYTVNEQGFSDQLINWHEYAIDHASTQDLKLVVGNMSIGTPEAQRWFEPEPRDFLRTLDRHRSHVVLGLHEYACGVITSGFLGGYPDNAGVSPNSGQQGRNLIPPVSWPFRNEVDKITRFHCGRFKFITDACRGLGITAPRIAITEHGFDDLGDLKGWTNNLPKTLPYTTIRGWKTCKNLWNNWWGKFPGWSQQQSLFQQMIYADRTLYQNSCVEGQMIFCWGGADQWEAFDVSKAYEFQQLLEGYVSTVPDDTEPPNTEPPTPPPTEETVTFDNVIKLINKLKEKYES